VITVILAEDRKKEGGKMWAFVDSVDVNNRVFGDSMLRQFRWYWIRFFVSPLYGLV
jgi:hypothetical protein